MIELNDKELKLKRKEVVKCKLKIINTTHEINDEYEKKLEDVYVSWLLDFQYNLDKELNKLFLQDYISLEDYKVSPKLEKLILESKKNIKKDRIKNKLTLFDYNKINNTFSRIDKINKIALKHNENKFIQQSLNIFKNRISMNNIKLLNNLINLYEDYIKPYPYNNINFNCDNHYKVILFLKEVVTKFGSIEGLVKEFENITLLIIDKLSNYTVIYYDYDIKELKRKTRLFKFYNENYDILFSQILYSHEQKIIKGFNYYVYNLDNVFDKHNEKASKIKSDLISKKIKEIIYGDKNSLLKSLYKNEYSSLKNINDTLKYDLAIDIARKEINNLKDKNINIDTIKKVEDDLREFYNILNLKIKKKNAQFLEREKSNYSYLFSSIEGKKLDNQQIEAIIKNEENSLIIAGAGSGKTITIIGKILYILEKKLCKPEEILVISFTNASSDELRERVKALKDDDIQITNFHKLGISILKSCNNLKFNILSERYNCILYIVYNLFKDSNFKEKFENYIMEYYTFPYINEEFVTYEEYVKFLSDRKEMLYTIKGDKVKSFEEKKIANFLYLNGIRYIYEKEYKYNTRTNQFKKQYRPDFYLCDYDIYLEHFGVDKNGEPPWFYSPDDSDKYKKGMKWKTNLHKVNRTKLITTYSWEYKEGILLERLQQKLLMNNIKLNKMKMDDLSSLVSIKFKDFILEILLIIDIIKVREINIGYLYSLNNNSTYNDYDIRKNNLLIDIVNEIYIKYCNLLKSRNEIDYPDMIRMARKIVEQGKFNKKYKYIIIDEYQDISPDKVKLIKELKKDGNANLFCVGDDWQSIYGFASSNLHFFTNFEEDYGPTMISKIENTYRFGNDVISVSESFIEKNEYQIKKKLNSPINKQTKIDVCLFNSKTDSKINVVKSIIDNIPKGHSVLILDRYDDLDKYDKPCLKEIISNYKYKLNIEYKTIHRSKGLESDYVLVLNNEDSVRGFPSQKDDEKLVDLALERKEHYPFEEERRLFYVAITRAKKSIFLIVDTESQSRFIKEIIDHESVNIRGVMQTEAIKCNKCKVGKMEQMKSDKNKYICSKYPYCDNVVYKSNIIQNKARKYNNKKIKNDNKKTEDIYNLENFVRYLQNNN